MTPTKKPPRLPSPNAIPLIAVAAVLVACGGSVTAEGQSVDASADVPTPDAADDVIVESDVDAGDDAAPDTIETDGPEPSCADCWLSTSESGLGPTEQAFAAWTGHAAVVWGGGRYFPESPDVHAHPRGPGAVYDLQTDDWELIPSGGPNGFADNMVWTGDYILEPFVSEPQLWGRNARFTPDSAAWEWAEADYAPPPDLAYSQVVWVSGRAILWGRASISGDCGGSYDPVENAWTAITPPDPSLCRGGDAAVVVAGDRMFVWGGTVDDQSEPLNTGVLYDPATDTWTPTTIEQAPSARIFPRAVWTGSNIIVWGEKPAYEQKDDPCTGAVYDPDDDSWTPLPTDGAPRCAKEAQAIWGDGRMYVWRGSDWGELGGMYDLDTDAWTAMSDIDAPVTGAGAAVVWMNTELLVWGGRHAMEAADTRGWRYRPPPK